MLRGWATWAPGAVPCQRCSVVLASGLLPFGASGRQHAWSQGTSALGRVSATAGRVLASWRKSSEGEHLCGVPERTWRAVCYWRSQYSKTNILRWFLPPFLLPRPEWNVATFLFCCLLFLGCRGCTQTHLLKNSLVSQGFTSIRHLGIFCACSQFSTYHTNSLSKGAPRWVPEIKSRSYYQEWSKAKALRYTSLNSRCCGHCGKGNTESTSLQGKAL